MHTDHDVVVVGAGFAGLYAVHRLRDELGLDVRGFEAAEGVGGTWWWNRYPGARCDIESVHYSYSFSDDLQREWEWTERFAAQPEILAYLEHVAERFDLRRSFRFSTRVTSLVWDEPGSFWTVGTDDGGSCTARFVIAATGILSDAKPIEYPGADDFRGDVHMTSSWPHEGVDFSGRRVGIIGTGATGIQAIPLIAREAARLTVFQRTAQLAVPLRNRPVEPERRRWLADNHKQVRAGAGETFGGWPAELAEPSTLAATPEERRARYDRYWQEGFSILLSTYQDVLVDSAANDTIADYVREQIRDRVEDPALAELLTATNHPIGVKRLPLDTGYYEAYNRDNVRLVDLRAAPITTLTERGIRTADGEEHELEVIVFATGFDAVTGALLKMGIVGRDGAALAEHWRDGPRSYLGLAMNGFPNLFTISGPPSLAAVANNPLPIEDHVELATDMIRDVTVSGAATIEASAEAERSYLAMAHGVMDVTLYPQADSWYLGANVPGKPRAPLIFIGGVALYRAICAEMRQAGWAGFQVGGASTRIPQLLELDPAVAFIVGGMIIQGVKPLEECTLEEAREAVEDFALMQAAPPEVRMVETTYSAATEERPVRVYTPAAPEDAQALPVVVFFHLGGWAAGSIAVADATCRRLACELGAIVVSPSYRLAPEAPFPAATDDSFAALRWAAEYVGEHGGDPGRLVVAGESSGANLAAVAAQRARDEGGPGLLAQVLVYPPIDRDARTASREEFAAGRCSVSLRWTACGPATSAIRAAPSRRWPARHAPSRSPGWLLPWS